MTTESLQWYAAFPLATRLDSGKFQGCVVIKPTSQSATPVQSVRFYCNTQRNNQNDALHDAETLAGEYRS